MHGGTYEDPVTKKTRQYDIRAVKKNADRRISLAVECKALRDSFPLLVSRVPRTKDESHHEVIICQPPDRNRVHVGIPQTTRTVRLGHQHCIYDYAQPVGKATVQIGRKENGEIASGDAETFDKWSQALASIHGLIMDSTDIAEREKTDLTYHVAIPVLVVSDKTLWAVDYDSVTLRPSAPRHVDEATLFIEQEYSQFMPACQYTISHLHLYTETGFAGFVDGLSEVGSSWAHWFPHAGIRQAFSK